MFLYDILFSICLTLSHGNSVNIQNKLLTVFIISKSYDTQKSDFTTFNGFVELFYEIVTIEYIFKIFVNKKNRI